MSKHPISNLEERGQLGHPSRIDVPEGLEIQKEPRPINSQRLIVDDDLEVPPGTGNGEVVVLRLRDDDIVTQAWDVMHSRVLDLSKHN